MLVSFYKVSICTQVSQLCSSSITSEAERSYLSICFLYLSCFSTVNLFTQHPIPLPSTLNLRVHLPFKKLQVFTLELFLNSKEQSFVTVQQTRKIVKLGKVVRKNQGHHFRNNLLDATSQQHGYKRARGIGVHLKCITHNACYNMEKGARDQVRATRETDAPGSQLYGSRSGRP